ncbi:hypothetical protein J4E91_010346 [Alternaria rosae]|nr:hypothetical protein J4E91_010346 [Alternaria rosae]
MDDIMQAHAHAKDEYLGVYDEDETEQLRNLATYLDEKHAAGLEVLQQLKTVSSDTSVISLITDSELRVLLCAPDVEKHFTTFKYCSELFPVMGKTFVYLSDKAKKATAMLECFQIVLDCLLNYELSRPEEHFNGSEARLEFFGNMTSFVIPEVTLQQLEADRDVQQARNKNQEKSSEEKPSRNERGMLNIYHLAFNPESLKGLLDDEPSRNFEAVHLAFPEDENAMGIDVEDKQGSRLVWRDGKSYTILAVVEAKD